MTKDQRPNQYYELIDPTTGITYQPNPDRVWAFIKTSMNVLLKNNRVVFPSDNSKRPMLKRFKDNLKTDVNPISSLLDKVGMNAEGTRIIRELFGATLFNYSKPVSLLTELIQQVAGSDDIVLDFFSGSSVTAHAVLELNQLDKENRKFICVQLPEPTGENSEAFKAGYKTIADIGKERIRRVIKKLKSNTKQKNEKDKNNPKLFKNPEHQTGNNNNLGFKVFKLAKSNFSLWNADVEKTPESIQQQLSLHVKHISPEAEQEAILFELLIKSGIPIATPIKKISLPAGKGKKVGVIFSIDDNELIICLEKQLTHELIKGIAELKPQRVICLDEGFQNNDQLKTNAALIMKSNGVIKFQTV
jgi:adenine-specific DNA-methyltransferase